MLTTLTLDDEESWLYFSSLARVLPLLVCPSTTCSLAL
ncbi:hypothetical protein A2U01_0066056, partial [Trifolium medium]|nr:hypothetical protein [Trifolium medium]